MLTCVADVSGPNHVSMLLGSCQDSASRNPTSARLLRKDQPPQCQSRNRKQHFCFFGGAYRSFSASLLRSSETDIELQMSEYYVLIKTADCNFRVFSGSGSKSQYPRLELSYPTILWIFQVINAYKLGRKRRVLTILDHFLLPKPSNLLP